MAESAANFTFTTQNKPSIFEVIAQKSLNDTIHPALQKVALFLSTNFPKKFHWLGKYYDETFLALSALLEYNYLKHYDATFSENFYGLKRVLSSARNLTEHDRGISLLFVVLLPYFKRKLDEKISLYRLEEADGCLRNNFDGNLKKLLLRLHSIFEITWTLVTIYNYLHYMSGDTDIQLPILKMIDQKLVYGDPEPEVPSFWSSIFKGQFMFPQSGILKSAVASSLGMMAFFLQFLQTWNSQKSNYNITSLPSVSAPPFDNKAKNYQNRCPLCLQTWKIPTVLPVSGYVFCFPCIMRYLRENQKCPVTNLPAKPLDVVRLYDGE